MCVPAALGSAPSAAALSNTSPIPAPAASGCGSGRMITVMVRPLNVGGAVGDVTLVRYAVFVAVFRCAVDDVVGVIDAVFVAVEELACIEDAIAIAVATICEVTTVSDVVSVTVAVHDFVIRDEDVIGVLPYDLVGVTSLEEGRHIDR